MDPVRGSHAYVMESATNAGSATPSSTVSVSVSQKDVVANLSGAENPVPSVPVPSFSVVVAEKNISAVATPVQDENALPNHPLTAFFTPQVRLPAADVFCALRESNVMYKTELSIMLVVPRKIFHPIKMWN